VRPIAVRIKNMLAGLAARVELRETAKQLGTGTGTFCLLHGPSGSGKTFTWREMLAQHVAEGGHGFSLRAREVWPPHTMLAHWLEAVAGHDFGLHTPSDLYARLVEVLRKHPGSITVFDEADYLLAGPRHPRLNIVRDVADEAGHSVIFISVTSLAHRLQHPSSFTAQIATRVVAEVPFGVIGIADAGLLSRELIEGVELARDAVSACLRASGGSIRMLLRLYARIEQAAAAGGVRGTLNLAQAVRFGLLSAPAAESNQPQPIRAAESKKVNVA
jgi:hypothetical protein